MSRLHFLERSARVFADRLAVVDGDERLTNQEFHAYDMALAGGLQGLGVRPGDRVAFMARNGLLLAAHFAIPRLGAVFVAINTRLSQFKSKHSLAFANIAAFIQRVRWYNLSDEEREQRVTRDIGSTQFLDALRHAAFA